MLRKMMMLLLLLYYLILLTGCGNYIPKPKTIVVTKIKIEKVRIPNELLEVNSIPRIPDDISKQSSVADYSVNLLENDIECHDKIKNIKKFLK